MDNHNFYLGGKESVKEKIPKEEKEKRDLLTKKRAKYGLIVQGDIHQAIIDAMEGEIKIDSQTRAGMKKHFGREPFGGNRKSGGGWNSTAYAIIKALVKSGRFYIKK